MTAEKPESAAKVMNRLKRAVAAIPGAKLIRFYAGNYEGYHVDAPDGQVWSCRSVHNIRCEWRVKDKADKLGALADAADSVEQGVTACDDPECDYCHG